MSAEEPVLQLVDTHAHLTWASFDDLPATVARAREQGVERILSAGVDVPSSAAAIDLAGRFPEVYAATGVHPTDVGEDDRFEELAILAQAPRVVAIGETGLDYYRAAPTAPLQRVRLDQHLALAVRHGLPIVLHNRAADQDLLAALSNVGSRVRMVLHCFSSTWSIAERALSLGCYLSFAGNVTYKNAADLRAVAALVPPDRLLVETDAPFLSPGTLRGRRNEPANVAVTLRELAACRGVAPADLARQIQVNARAVFAW